jgi:hypothetical protein
VVSDSVEALLVLHPQVPRPGAAGERIDLAGALEAVEAGALPAVGSGEPRDSSDNGELLGSPGWRKDVLEVVESSWGGRRREGVGSGGARGTEENLTASLMCAFRFFPFPLTLAAAAAAAARRLSIALCIRSSSSAPGFIILTSSDRLYFVAHCGQTSSCPSDSTCAAPPSPPAALSFPFSDGGVEEETVLSPA